MNNPPTAEDKDTPREGSITVIEGHIRKADTQALITNGTDGFPEDSYAGQYWSGSGAVTGVAIIEPTFKPGTLYALMAQNNTLQQCVEAMEVNVDGTGHSISLIDASSGEDEVEKTMMTDFFKEPYPDKSMIQIRRSIRRDLETTGNGYLEIIRSANDEITLLNSVDSDEMRLIRLGASVIAKKTIVRNGVSIAVNIRTRERRYVQNVNGKKVYFKEYGSSRDIDRDTGEWALDGVRLPLEKRGSEILHFSGNREPKTPYGAPRWINQLPSVLGSRKAEESNLEFFDGGGIPPVLILIEGGTVGATVKSELKAHLSGVGAKNRAAVVEIASTSGSLDAPGKVGVRVERFGSEQQKDSLYQNYDKETAEHVRTSFRLPPVFLGKSQDYSFATAYTSYMVAEAQVFFPEREEFDSKINGTIVKELGAKKYVFRSLPLTLVDVVNQLKAIELITAGKYADGKEVVDTLNEITGLSVEYTEPPTPVVPEVPAAATATKPVVDAQSQQGVGTGKLRAVKTEDDTDRLIKLANDWVEANGLLNSETITFYNHSDKDRIAEDIADLSPDESRFFNQIIATKCLVHTSSDLEGLAELCACTTHSVT